MACLCVKKIAKKHSDDKTNGYQVLLVGSTGLGKSSVIKMFTKNNSIKVSTNSESTTSEITSYNDPNNSNRYWIDTIGAEDSNMQLDDEQTLNLAQKSMYKNKKINHLKILWFIKPDQRKTSTLQIQAQFINKFGPNIWKSVIIIVNKPDDIIDASQGAIAAATDLDKNNNVKNMLIKGFKCMDWMSNIPPLVKKATPKDRQEMFWYTQKEMMESIQESLNKIPSSLIAFYEKTCKNCNITSDPRFCDDPCHHSIISRHKSELPDRVHIDKTEKYHEKSKEKYHSGKIIYKHNGIIVNKKIEIGSYHNDSEIKVVQRCKCGNTNVRKMSVKWEGVFGWRSRCRASCGRDVNTNEVIYHCPDCCNKSSSHLDSRTSFWDCNGYYCGRCMENCWPRIEICSKCKKAPSSKGCNTQYRTNVYYSCCNNDKNSTGCKKYCQNCNNLYEDIGCEDRYSCCKDMINSEGCQERYKCCKSDVRHNPIGCKYEWKCCNEIVEDNNNKGKECQTICKMCEQPWGSRPGCTNKVQHEFA